MLKVPFVTLQKQVRNTRVLPARLPPGQATRTRAAALPCGPGPHATSRDDAVTYALTVPRTCTPACLPAWVDQLMWQVAEVD